MLEKHYHLFDESEAPIEQIGSKAYHLMYMKRMGLPVPNGFVLNADFFLPWMVSLQQTQAWLSLIKAAPTLKIARLKVLRSMTLDFRFFDQQRAILDQAMASLDAYEVFAVRSSSPDEDMEDASFAGLYDSYLNVGRSELEAYILKAFSACMEERLYTYKQTIGLDPEHFSIAVIVMPLIQAEVSGVGFSINPINLDQDATTINAVSGLGDKLVSGQVSPDSWTVNAQTNEITSFIEGADTQLPIKHIIAVHDLIKTVESLYDKPMDIEWCYEGESLYLLQARPITTFRQLHPQILTQPHESRRLYLDVGQSVQGMDKPFSHLGGDFLRDFLESFSNKIYGDGRLVDIQNGIVDIIDGRLLVNIPNLVALLGKKRVIALINQMDMSMAETIAALDLTQFHQSIHVRRFKFSKLALVNRFWRTLMTATFYELFPRLGFINYRKKIDRFVKKLSQLNRLKLPVTQRIRRYQRFMVDELLHTFIPALIVCIKARHAALSLDANLSSEQKASIQALMADLPYNITLEMGKDLKSVAMTLVDLPIEDYHSFEVQFLENAFPEVFKKKWYLFMKHYGFRGPSELDIASPRYKDGPTLLLKQLYPIVQSLKARGTHASTD